MIHQRIANALQNCEFITFRLSSKTISNPLNLVDLWAFGACYAGQKQLLNMRSPKIKFSIASPGKIIIEC